MLYLVATPIGNLKDITYRAIETLNRVDAIICEDTRRSSILLNHYEIKKPFIILNDYNEKQVLLSVLDRLQAGQEIALISDAGTPLISDPGYKLVRECLSLDIPLDSLPGASAAILALTLSGLSPDKFYYVGYLPEKSGKRGEMLKKLAIIGSTIPTTFIIYVAPHKLLKTLQEIMNQLGDIEITLAAELTKLHQKVSSKTISEHLIEIKNPKGEFVLLLRLPQE